MEIFGFNVIQVYIFSIARVTEINIRYFELRFFDKWRKIFSIRKSNLFLILLLYIRKSIDKANFLLNRPVTWNENLMYKPI